MPVVETKFTHNTVKKSFEITPQRFAFFQRAYENRRPVICLEGCGYVTQLTFEIGEERFGVELSEPLPMLRPWW